MGPEMVTEQVEPGEGSGGAASQAGAEAGPERAAWASTPCREHTQANRGGPHAESSTRLGSASFQGNGRFLRELSGARAGEGSGAVRVLLLPASLWHRLPGPALRARGYTNDAPFFGLSVVFNKYFLNVCYVLGAGNTGGNYVDLPLRESCSGGPRTVNRQLVIFHKEGGGMPNS